MSGFPPVSQPQVWSSIDAAPEAGKKMGKCVLVCTKEAVGADIMQKVLVEGGLTLVENAANKKNTSLSCKAGKAAGFTKQLVKKAGPVGSLVGFTTCTVDCSGQ